VGILIRVRAWVHPQFGAEFDHRFVSREAAKDVRRKSCMDFLRLGVRKIFWQRNSDFFVASRETNFSAADSFARVYSKNDTAVDMQFASKGGCTCEMLRLFVRAQRCTSKTPNDHDPG
jgi:hypothetical protein